MTITRSTLAVFTLMNFVLAMISSVFNGILDQVAVSMDISVANAGMLNTMYAYGAAFGVPVALILFRKVERVKMLKIMLLLTILMTVALVLTQSFWQLLLIRLAMGVSANCYSVLGISVAASLSAPERLGRTMAILIAGNAFALVAGIPLTRALSSVLSWQGVFWILSGMMALALFYFVMRLKLAEQKSPSLNLSKELAFIRERKVLSVILFSLVMFIGYGALYTYITPFLLSASPSIETMMTLILVLIGAASFAGNLIGGYVSDRIGYVRSMLLGGGLQLTAAAFILVFRSVGWLCVVFSILWIMSAWFTGLQLNTGISRATENKSSFMISVNSSAIQLGTAIGSSMAAVIISVGGIQNIIYLTLLCCVSAIIVHLISMKKTAQATSR